MTDRMKNRTFESTRYLPIISCGVVLLAACTSPNETGQNDYGNSVRHMIAVQTASPGRGPQGLDGQKASLILQKYRMDVPDPKEVDAKALGTETATKAGGSQ